jgi:uncharacterized protein (TIGR01370 family)
VLALLGSAATELVLPSRTALAASSRQRDFAVYYSAEDDPALSDFALLVLDSDTHPPLLSIAQRAARRPTLLGYLALAEVSKERRYAAWLRRQKLLLGANPDWPDAAYIDLRAKAWQRHVIEALIPGILAAGFDGVFLDTLDDAAELEEREPKHFRGMKSAAVELVQTIRRRFPQAKLMMNRGLALLPLLGGTLDMVLGESLLAAYDFATKSHDWVAPERYRAAAETLQEARRRHPALGLYTLDYWDPDDAAGVARIYATQRASGFVPYVATIGLDRIVSGPDA